MTESEAIKIFNDLLDVSCEMLIKYDSVINSEKKQALVRIRTAEELAIKALEKQMKLNEMGDCYIIPKNGVFEVNGVDVNLAIQKQIPKKLINTCQYVSGCCPNCKKYISDWLEYNKFMCCPYCGQKLDFGE